jgi:hypothetical protein
MASIRALVKPELLKWARTSANLEPLAAARKINVPDERVNEWEQGEVAARLRERRLRSRPRFTGCAPRRRGITAMDRACSYPYLHHRARIRNSVQ